ncbi:MAG: PEP-CTERM sorting domain-containing protein, partial [Pirellulales bacterium]|nr:PEP-CTERM sorting domain-containing protein [Pirellulales bacterium]
PGPKTQPLVHHHPTNSSTSILNVTLSQYTTTHIWGGHPNGTNANMSRLPVEQWAVRRWVSEVTGEITISGVMDPINGGNMYTHVIIDGSEVYQHQVPNEEFNYTVIADVNVGSTVDFVISPNNHDDVNGDTKFTATIDFVPEPSTITLLLFGLTSLALIRRR